MKTLKLIALAAFALLFSQCKTTWHSLKRTSPSLRSILILAILFVFASSGCDLTKTNGTSSTSPHETKIIVKLSGTYATSETVDVTIGSGGATTIGYKFADEAYANVDPGTYVITGVSHKVPGTWTHSTTIEQGQQKTIELTCNEAVVTVMPDPLWIGTHNFFGVGISTDQGYIYWDKIPAGGSYAFTIHPGKDYKISIYDPVNGKGLSELTQSFFYDEKFTLTIPYK